MRFRLAGWLSFAILTGSFAPLAAEEKVKEVEHYPLKVGTTWEYKAGGQTITVQVAKHEKLDDEQCAVLETKVGGNTVATEHISVRKDGMFRHTMAGQKVDPPVCFMKLPIKKGEAWKIASKIAGQDLKVEYTMGEEEVTVPAGKYKAIFTKTSKFSVAGMEMEATIWYAKGVGMVKTVMDISGNKIELELDKYTAGK